MSISDPPEIGAIDVGFTIGSAEMRHCLSGMVAPLPER